MTRPPVIVDLPEVAPADLLGRVVAEVPTPKAAARGVLPSGGVVREVLTTRVVHGSFRTGQVAWYRVSFARPFKTPPTVLAHGHHRPGWFDDLQFQAPLLDKGQVAGMVASAMHDSVVRAVNIPILGDALGGLAYAIGWVTGFVFAFLMNIVSPVLSQMSSIALNGAPLLLYGASDRPQMKLTTAETRNVSEAGFELLGVPDGEFTWVALGER